MRWLVSVVVALALVTGIDVPGADAAVTYPRVVLARNGDIYTVRADGRDLRRLTWTGNNSEPRWSPDRSRIVFSSTRDGDSEIYTMTADGKSVRQLTKNRVYDGQATWSPDGRMIAFVRDVRFCTCGYGYTTENHVFVMRADGSNQRELSKTFMYLYRQPQWSPNGKYISVQGYEAYFTDDYTYVFDVAGNRVLDGWVGAYGPAFWTVDNRLVACSHYGEPPPLYGLGDGGCYAVTIGGKAELLYVGPDQPGDPAHPPLDFSVLSMTSGGRFHVYIRRDTKPNGAQRIRLFSRALETDTELVLAELKPPAAHPVSLGVLYDWAPDGRVLAANTTAGLTLLAPDLSGYRVNLGPADSFDW